MSFLVLVTGFFFGRTKLINLSPKKTWEGFLGAFGSTLVWGVLVSESMCRGSLVVWLSWAASVSWFCCMFDEDVLFVCVYIVYSVDV